MAWNSFGACLTLFNWFPLAVRFEFLHDVSVEVEGQVGTRLVAGKSAFALPFGKGDARKLVAAVTVSGVAPESQRDWEPAAVHRMLLCTLRMLG